MNNLHEINYSNGTVTKYRQFTVIVEDKDGIEVIALSAEDAQAIALEQVDWFGGYIEVTDTTPTQSAPEKYGIDSVEKFNALFC